MTKMIKLNISDELAKSLTELGERNNLGPEITAHKLLRDLASRPSSHDPRVESIEFADRLAFVMVVCDDGGRNAAGHGKRLTECAAALLSAVRIAADERDVEMHLQGAQLIDAIGGVEAVLGLSVAMSKAADRYIEGGDHE